MKRSRSCHIGHIGRRCSGVPIAAASNAANGCVAHGDAWRNRSLRNPAHNSAQGGRGCSKCSIKCRILNLVFTKLLGNALIYCFAVLCDIVIRGPHSSRVHVCTIHVRVLSSMILTRNHASSLILHSCNTWGLRGLRGKLVIKGNGASQIGKRNPLVWCSWYWPYRLCCTS